MRILIDLTDIERWAGHHGGIQRVVYGITKNFYVNGANQPYEIEYISYQETDKKFIYSNFEPIYERVESRLDPKDQSSPIQSARVRARLGIREYVPESIRKNQLARKSFKGAIRVAKKSLNKTKSIASTQSGNGEGRFVLFQKSDIVLVLGKPWDNLDIQRTLSRERQVHKFKLIQVVYDMIISLYPHLHHPSLFEPYSIHMFEAVANSDLLLPISKSSDNDLGRFCEILNLNKPTTRVIRLGDDIADKKKLVESKKPDIRIESEFLLCVGTIEIRKNHNLLYNTYKLAQEKGIMMPQLVIVGSKGWLSHDVQYLIKKDPSIKSRILILNNIDDVGLDWLYKNCLFTVYPSMYEGWGLPIAESLSYGKMCIASNSSSMTEIAGDLIDYFSPYDTEECLARIAPYLTPENRIAKENQIKKAYKLSSWSSTYDTICRYINSIKN